MGQKKKENPLKSSRVFPHTSVPCYQTYKIVNQSNVTNYITMVEGQTTFWGTKYTISTLAILSKNKLIKWGVINVKVLPVTKAHFDSKVEATIQRSLQV
jgi:hypothetical protein